MEGGTNQGGLKMTWVISLLSTGVVVLRLPTTTGELHDALSVAEDLEGVARDVDDHVQIAEVLRLLTPARHVDEDLLDAFAQLVALRRILVAAAARRVAIVGQDPSQRDIARMGRCQAREVLFRILRVGGANHEPGGFRVARTARATKRRIDVVEVGNEPCRRPGQDQIELDSTAHVLRPGAARDQLRVVPEPIQAFALGRCKRILEGLHPRSVRVRPDGVVVPRGIETLQPRAIEDDAVENQGRARRKDLLEQGLLRRLARADRADARNVGRGRLRCARAEKRWWYAETRLGGSR